MNRQGGRSRSLRPYHQGQADFFCALYAVINALVITYGIGLGTARQIFSTTLGKISEHPFLWRSTLNNETDFYWLVEYLLGFSFSSGPLALHTLVPAGAGFQEKKFGLEHRNLRDVNLYRKPERKPACGLNAGELWTVLRHWLPEDCDPRHSERVDYCYPPAERPAANDKGDNGDKAEAPGCMEESGVPHGQRALLLRFHRYLPFSDQPVISHWSTARAFYGEDLLLFDATADPEAIHRLPLAECVVSRADICREKSILLETSSLFLIERTGVRLAG